MTEQSFIEKPRVSCALGGALATVNVLPRTVPILHASVGCGGMNSAAVGGAAGYLGSGYCGGNALPASGIGEREIVFGGHERLAEQLKNTAEVIDADLFVVISGCTAEIIGDDVPAVLRDYNSARGDRPPAILVSGAGFKGDSLWGYDAALEALVRDVVYPSRSVRKGAVNVWGIPPAQDVWWYGNLLEIRRLLSKLGLDVNTFFTAHDKLDRIRNAGEAQYNLVLSPVNGLEAARAFERTHGTPWLSTDLPVGAKATETFLREVGEKLSIDSEKIETVIAEERYLYYHAFNRLADAYSDIDLQRYAVLIGTTNYAHALTKFVTLELGWLPELTVITDAIREGEQAAIRQRFSGFVDHPEETVVFETDTSQIPLRLQKRWPAPNGSPYARKLWPAFVLGSRLDKEFAESIGAGHLSVSYPVSNRVILDRGYAGFNGGLRLSEDIYSVVLGAR